MVNMDDHTSNVIEIAGQGAKLTEELILKVLKSLSDLFSKDKDNRDFVIKDNTIAGKQKIKELVSKHKDGVMALDDNITKEQVKDYQKEFKKMGVDFSIVKNDKDSYSFFFASRDANIIEKSLKNIIEKKNLVLDSKSEIELGEKPELENLVELNPDEKQLANKLSDLSPEEQALFMKINEVEISNQEQKIALTDLQKGLSEEQVKNVHDLYKENVFVSDTEPPKDKILASEIEQVQNNILQSETELDAGEVKIDTRENDLKDSLKELSPKEQDLFQKLNEVDELKTDLSTEQIENVQNLHSEIVNINSISKEEQLDNIFNQLAPEEKDFFIETNEIMLNPDSDRKLDSYSEARDKLSEEQINKVDELYNENIHDEKDIAPKGKIHMNDIEKISENLIMEKQLEKDSQLEYVSKLENSPLENITEDLTSTERVSIDTLIDEKINVLEDHINDEKIGVLNTETNGLLAEKNDLSTIKEDLLEGNLSEEGNLAIQNIIDNKIETLSDESYNIDSDFKELEAIERSDAEPSGYDEAREKLQNNQDDISNKISDLSSIKESLQDANKSQDLSLEGKDKTVSKDINTVGKDKSVDKEKEALPEKEKSPAIFSVEGVKEIDKQLKEKEKNNDKDKKRDKELSL